MHGMLTLFENTVNDRRVEYQIGIVAGSKVNIISHQQTLEVNIGGLHYLQEKIYYLNFTNMLHNIFH